MISRRPNNLQEDQLITAYLQRRVIITSVTQDSDGEQYFIDGISFSKLQPVKFGCWGDETIIELYRKDVRWDIHTAYGDPRLAYLREKGAASQGRIRSLVGDHPAFVAPKV